MSTQDEVIINGGERQYWTVLTAQGEAAIAAQLLAGTKLDVTHIAAGDGGGAYYEPSADQTALVREVWRGEIAAYTVNPLNPRMLDIKGVIPSSEGGFTIREIGVFDRAGTLVGVCNTPAMEKATLASGAGGKLDLIMHLLVTDANAVNIVVRPSLDTVSLADVTKLLGGKQDKLTGEPGQVPVFGESGNLEARDFSNTAVVPFEASEWGEPAPDAPEETPAAESQAEGEPTEDPPAYDGARGWELVIPAEKHGRKSGDFTFQIFHLVAGKYLTSTWGAIGTEVRYDEAAGNVILASPDPYSGKILFVG